MYTPLSTDLDRGTARSRHRRGILPAKGETCSRHEGQKTLEAAINMVYEHGSQERSIGMHAYVHVGLGDVDKDTTIGLDLQVSDLLFAIRVTYTALSSTSSTRRWSQELTVNSTERRVDTYDKTEVSNIPQAVHGNSDIRRPSKMPIPAQ